MNQSEKKKQAILNVTKDFLQSRTVKDIKMEEIAQKAEVSKVTVFKYFESKEKLINTVILKELMVMVEQMREILSQELDFEATYRAITAFKVDQILTFTPTFTDNIMHQYVTSPDFFNLDARGLQKEMFGEMIKRGRAEHKINPDLTDEEIFTLVDIFDEGMKVVDINFLVTHSESINTMFLNALR